VRPRTSALTEAEREERQRERAKARPIEIAISDASGRMIRSLRGTNRAGLNRVYWDLRYEPTVPVRLRTTPAGNPHVWEEKRFRGQEHRGVFYYGITETRRGPLVAPGTYTVTLKVDGKAQPPQSLTVLRDPNTGRSEADVLASSDSPRHLPRHRRDGADDQRPEWTRKQLRLAPHAQGEQGATADFDAVAPSSATRA
jgi:hypothetical protein